MNSLDKIKAYTENLRQIAKTMPIGNTGYDKVESVCDALDLATTKLKGECYCLGSLVLCDVCEVLNQIAEKLD